MLRAATAAQEGSSRGVGPMALVGNRRSPIHLRSAGYYRMSLAVQGRAARVSLQFDAMGGGESLLICTSLINEPLPSSEKNPILL